MGHRLMLPVIEFLKHDSFLELERFYKPVESRTVDEIFMLSVKNKIINTKVAKRIKIDNEKQNGFDVRVSV